jgi:hypothetical protein
MFLFKTDTKKKTIEKPVKVNVDVKNKLKHYDNIIKNEKLMDKIRRNEKIQRVIYKLDKETLETFNENIDTFERFINSYLFEKKKEEEKPNESESLITTHSNYNDLLANMIKIANTIKLNENDPMIFIDKLMKHVFSPKFEDKKEKIVFIKTETLLLKKLKEMKTNKEMRIRLVKNFIEYLILTGVFNGENSITIEDNNEVLFYFLLSGINFKDVNIKLLVQFFKFEYFIAEPFYSVISPNMNIKSNIIKDKFKKDYYYRYSKDKNIQDNYFKLLLHLDYDFNVIFYQYENNNKKYVYIKLEPNPILGIEQLYNSYSVNKYDILQMKKMFNNYDKYKTLEFLFINNNIKKLMSFIKDINFKIPDVDNTKQFVEYLKKLLKESEENTNNKFIEFLSEVLAKADETFDTIMNNYYKNVIPIQERISDVEYQLKELKQKNKYYNYYEKLFKFLNQEKGNLEGFNLKSKIQITDNIYLSQKFIEPKSNLPDKFYDDIKKYMDEDITSPLLEEILKNYDSSNVINEQIGLKILGNFKNYELTNTKGGSRSSGLRRILKTYSKYK